MPLIKIHLSAHLTTEKKDKLLTDATKIVADTTGKPIAYVMAAIESADISLAGKGGPGAFVDIRGIGGLSPDINKKLSAGICGLLKQSFDIDPNRIFLNFTDVPPSNWGWNNGTFG